MTRENDTPIPQRSLRDWSIIHYSLQEGLSLDRGKKLVL